MSRTNLVACFSLFLLLALTTSTCVAQEVDRGRPVHVIFEETLDRDGFEAAMSGLREMMEDTTGTYEFDPRELVIMVPSRLAADGGHANALEFLLALETLYGVHQRYWMGVGDLSIMVGDRERAVSALERVLEAHPDRSDIAWRIEHIEDLIETAKLQVEAEGKYEPGENTGLKGPYLGQDPPGRDFEVFAPGILSSTGHEYSITFMPDGREIYFSRGGDGIFVCRWEKEGWTAPEPIVFIEDHEYSDEPNISPDGRRVVFCSRPTMADRRELYAAERDGDDWGEPVHIFRGMYATSALDGDLYFTLDPVDQPGNSDIVKSSRTEEGWDEPVALEGGVNSKFQEAHPYVAPDESYVIFDTYRDTIAGLAICFRKPDGTWGEPHFLSEVLSIPYVGQAVVSPDGKYLFFCFSGDMYWMSAAFIEELRPIK